VPKADPNFDRAQWLEQNRCTSCGICAKVCPPQCIWIVRTNDPKTGKPIPQPSEFYIDTDICMNCGYCAEFCPFDAIKMDHDFELADYEREVAHVHDLDRLLKPVSYYASIRPTWYAKEEEARRAAEEEKRRKEEERQRQAAEREAKAKQEAEAAAKAAAATQDGGEPQAEAKPQRRSPEEIKAQREAMLARKRQRADETGAETTAAPAAESDGSAAQAETSPAAPAEMVEAATKIETATTATAVPSQPDDLTIIEGIGPKISRMLQSSGITTYAQLAAAEVSWLRQLLEENNLARLANPTTWPEQARLAADGKWAELKTLQDQLQGGRRRT
jgi:formate hydrogenlyase subunit 6/NADH:ubiquinone oxidoreductase subunit I/predicted flap endonuclease-1-like 5' DNA nuclease